MIYSLSLHDALPISIGAHQTISQPYIVALMTECLAPRRTHRVLEIGDRKSTRLNSSHPSISYAVFCLKKNTLSGLLLVLCVIVFGFSQAFLLHNSGVTLSVVMLAILWGLLRDSGHHFK